MSVSTVASHVKRALSFFNDPAIYLGIGKSSAWADDNNPPAPDTNATTLLELIGFRKADNVYMVVQDNTNGTIAYQNTKWSIVTPSNAYTQGAKWVYVSATINYDELPLGYYRQVGVFSGLQLANGVSGSQLALLPAQVSNVGTLEVIDNRQPSNRQTNQKETLSVVIEF